MQTCRSGWAGRCILPDGDWTSHHSVDVEPPTTSDHLLLSHLHGSMFGRRRVRELHTGPLGRLGCLCDSDVCIWFGDGLGGGALRLEGPVFDIGAQVPRAQGVIPRDVTV